jgi:hypothetical protein
MEEVSEPLALKFALVFPHLDERQRRIMAAAEARFLGHGGITAVAEASGMSRSTVSAAVAELKAGLVVTERVRRPGGGRKSITETYPGIKDALEALVGPDTRGDPESPLLWTLKSTRQLADELQAQGYEITHVVVGDLLRNCSGPQSALSDKISRGPRANPPLSARRAVERGMCPKTSTSLSTRFSPATAAPSTTSCGP